MPGLRKTTQLGADPVWRDASLSEVWLASRCAEVVQVVVGPVCLVLTGLLAYGFGARGWILAAAVPIGFFPVVMVSSTIARRVLPPTLIFSDDYLADIKNRK